MIAKSSLEVPQPLLLAGDIGATKTLLGIFEPGPGRPRPITTSSFLTSDVGDLSSLVARFLTEVGGAVEIVAACFGVAGPVVGSRATLTNLDWHADAGDIASRFAIPRVELLNDLQAMALSLPVLEPAERLALQEGQADGCGNLALIAAGTGLGEAVLVRVGREFVAAASEGGHADFAARTEREIDVLRALTARLGRAQVEDVVSGPGLANLHRATHRGHCSAVEDVDAADAPRLISGAALGRACRGCMDALELFVDAYGAEAGNLALRSVATGGVYVGGGIAPQIVPALTSGRFLRAFLDKAPMQPLLERMPVHVILNREAGLLGAAVGAARLAPHGAGHASD